MLRQQAGHPRGLVRSEAVKPCQLTPVERSERLPQPSEAPVEGVSVARALHQLNQREQPLYCEA
jgi:hypothetical protein